MTTTPDQEPEVPEEAVLEVPKLTKLDIGTGEKLPLTIKEDNDKRNKKEKK